MTRFPRGSRLSRVVARLTSTADVVLAARIMMWACILPILKQILPIRPLVKLVWRAPRLEPDGDREERVVTFARWACRLTRWKSGGNCLERALIAYRFLLEGGAAPTLVIGMGSVTPAEIVGHAWVLLNGMPAGESAASVSGFVPALVFGPDGVLVRSVESGDVPDRSPVVRWS
jgi:hypothetical protein